MESRPDCLFWVGSDWLNDLPNKLRSAIFFPLPTISVEVLEAKADLPASKQSKSPPRRKKNPSARLCKCRATERSPPRQLQRTNGIVQPDQIGSKMQPSTLLHAEATMDIPSAHEPIQSASHSLKQAGRGLARFSWNVVRLPIVATLAVLEPVVRTILAGIALLGILTALFSEFIVRAPNFPFWPMIGVSVGSALLLMVYYAVMRVFSAR